MEPASNNSTPLISIIISSHNYEAYLPRAIGSALGQTWPSVEVIVIDDGSTDGSADIIRSFGDRITAIFKECAGQCSCINLGFEKARGEIIMLLDADDVLLPDAARLHAEEFATPGTVKSCGYMEVMSENGQLTGKRIPARLPDSGHYREATLAKGLDIFNTSFTSGHAWSRDFLAQVLPLPEVDKLGPDGYLTSIDRLFGRLAFVHQPVVHYRRHNRNKGPIRYRFDVAYMKKRLLSRELRLAYAEEWLEKLGYEYDPEKFRAIRDWRLLLMKHILWLKGETTGKTPFLSFVTTPFRNPRRPLIRSARIGMALLAVRLLPRNSALSLSQTLLEKALGGNAADEVLGTSSA